MPRRPLASMSIDQLEKLFDAKRQNIDVLTILLSELSHRDRPRARRLNGRVIQALGVAPKAKPISDSADVGAKQRSELTSEDHRFVAAYLRGKHPEWDKATRAKASEFARHHDLLADVVDSRSPHT